MSRLSPEPLAEGVAERLHGHYLELCRWNTTLSLVGPGTVETILERHYGESLAALPWIPETGNLVDIGSGAGFPGLVLAVARPLLRVTLVESSERKWAFLNAACRRTSLPCQCVNARVATPLPAGIPPSIDAVTVRAVKVSPELFEPLLPRLALGGRLLLWCGGRAPQLPRGLDLEGHARLGGQVRELRIYRKP